MKRSCPYRRQHPDGRAHVLSQRYSQIGPQPSSADGRRLLFASYDRFSSSPVGGLLLLDLQAPEQPPIELNVPRHSWVAQIDFLATPDH